MENNNNIEDSFEVKDSPEGLIHSDHIIEQFRALKNKEDLLELLNKILATELGKTSKKKFTVNQFNYFLARLAGKKDSIGKNPDKDIYSTFEIKKKSGAPRTINAPDNELVLLLHCIDILVKKIYKPHHCAYGFIEGKSIVDNVKIHVVKNYLYNIDLKDFFHSFDLRVFLIKDQHYIYQQILYLSLRNHFHANKLSN